MPPTPPGWSDFRAVFGSAYDGWEFYSTLTVDREQVIRYHPAPSPSSPALVKDASYAGTQIDADALYFITAHEGDRAPYFLQVAPYAPHARVNPKPHYAGDPLFPSAFQDRPGPGRRDGNCGPLRCRSLTGRDLRGFGDPQRDNRPRRFDGSPALAWNENPSVLRSATAVEALPDRARMAQSAPTDDHPDPGVGRPRHLLGRDVRQRLPPRPTGLAMGTGTAYTTDSRVPLLVVGPGVAPGPRREMVSNLDLAPTFEALASLADRKAAERDYVFLEHTRSGASAEDPDRTPELDTIPSYVAVRSRTRLLIRLDLDRGPRTRYGWELYDLARDRFERTNVYGRGDYADDVRVLQRKLRQLDDCSSATRNDPVRDDCRTLAEDRN